MKFQHLSKQQRMKINEERLKKKARKEQTWVKLPPPTKEQFEDGIRRARLTARFDISGD